MSDPVKPAPEPAPKTDPVPPSDVDAFDEAINAEPPAEPDAEPKKDGDTPAPEPGPGGDKAPPPPPSEPQPTDEEKRVQELADQSEQSQAAGRWWDELLLLHPDAEDLRDSDRLKAWAAKQDRKTQECLGSGATAAQAAWALTKFKADEKGAPAPTPGPAPAAPSAQTQPGKLREFLTANKLADEVIEVTLDGEAKKMTLSELADTFPDVFDGQFRVTTAMMAQQERRLEERIRKAVAEARPATDDKLQRRLNRMDIKEAHSDYDTVRESKEFKEFLPTLEKRFQALFNEDDPEGTIAVLNLYKKHRAMLAKSEQEDANARRLRERRDLHGHTMRGPGGKSPKPTQAEGNDMEDFQAELDRDVKSS
jgi:hypothetical protein